MKSQDDIEAAFDRATEKAQAEPQSRKHWEAIMDALGWALGEYEDDPTQV